MGIEIKITGDTPLEVLSTLAATGNYCMFIPAVVNASATIQSGEKSAVTPGPRSASPATGTPPTPRPAPAPGNTPPATPPVSAASPAPAMPGAVGGATGNPTMSPASGSKSTMTPTSPFSQTSIPGVGPAPGNPVPVSDAPGFTLEQISRAGADLVTKQPEKMTQLSDALREFGAETLVELQPEHFGSFALKLRDLGATI